MKTNVIFKLWIDDEGQPLTELLVTEWSTKSTEITGWIWEDFDDMFSDWLTSTIGDDRTPEPGIYHAMICAEPTESLEGERDSNVWFENLSPVYLSGMEHQDDPGDILETVIKVKPFQKWHAEKCGSCGLFKEHEHYPTTRNGKCKNPQMKPMDVSPDHHACNHHTFKKQI